MSFFSRFLTGAEPAGGDQFIERPPGDQVAPRPDGEAGGVGAQRRHVYENVNLFQERSYITVASIALFLHRD